MSQIQKKFIGDNQIGADQVRLENDVALRARSQDGLSDIDILKVNTSDKIELLGDLSPDVTNTRSLGETGLEFASVHTNEITNQGTLVLNPATAVQLNSNLLFDTNNTKDIGSSTEKAANIYAVNTRTEYIFGPDTVELVINLEDVDGTLVLNPGGNANKAPRLGFGDYNNGNKIFVKAPDTLAADYTLTLPADDGNSNQVLTTNGSGVLSWTSVNDTGITELTGDVTAGPGNGSQAATIANNAVTTVKINANAVTGAKIRLDNDEAFKALNAAEDTDINILKVNTSDVIEVLGAVQVDGNITPDGNGTRSLGSGSAQYLDVVARNFGIGDGAVSVGAGDASATINIDNYGAATVAPRLGLTDYTNGNRVYIKSPNTLAASYTLTLPINDGNTDEVLKTDGSGNLSWVAQSAGSTPATETFVLDAGMITAQKVTLANTPIAGSVHFAVKGAPVLLEGASYDYTVSGADVNFENDLATGGVSELQINDIVQVKYMH
jgi:hypothetical protein